MSKVGKNELVAAAEKIHKSYTVVYKNGASGQLETMDGAKRWVCDCRGYVIWALRENGVSYSSTGTNWMIRKQMASVTRVTNPAELEVGQLVFKSRTNLAKMPSRYRKGKADYDPYIGEIDVYHVGIVVQTTPSLIIRHCTSGGIKTDTALGAWNWAGWLDVVGSTDATQPPVVVEYAKVVAPSGSTVNMRKGPSKSDVILVRVPIGASVILVSSTAFCGWYEVKYAGRTGFMMSEYVERG